LIPLGILFSCEPDGDLNDGLSSIKVFDAYQDRSGIFASEFFKDFQYVRLETSKESLSRDLVAAYPLGDSALLVQGFRRNMVFSAKTGEYIRDIGHFGEDPNGYRTTLSYYGVDEYRPTTFASGWKDNFTEYSISSGLIVDQVKKPKPDEYIPFESELILGSFARLDSINFIGYAKNFNGSQKIRLVVFKRDGEIVKTFPNYLSFVDIPGRYVSLGHGEGRFFKNAGEVYFKEYYNDTTYQVSLGEMIPVHKFELGQYSPPYSEKEAQRVADRKEFMFIKDILRTSEHLFFYLEFRDISYLGVFDFKDQSTRVSNLEHKDIESRHGLENDIDGFIPLYPTTVQGDMMISITPAEEVYYWFQNNPDKIASLPPELQVFRDIHPEDNPIITIARVI
jgi:hypothetical protein